MGQAGASVALASVASVASAAEDDGAWLSAAPSAAGDGAAAAVAVASLSSAEDDILRRNIDLWKDEPDGIENIILLGLFTLHAPGIGHADIR